MKLDRNRWKIAQNKRCIIAHHRIIAHHPINPTCGKKRETTRTDSRDMTVK